MLECRSGTHLRLLPLKMINVKTRRALAIALFIHIKIYIRYVLRFTKVVIFRAVRSARNCQLPLVLKGAVACALWCLKVRLRVHFGA